MVKCSYIPRNDWVEIHIWAWYRMLHCLFCKRTIHIYTSTPSAGRAHDIKHCPSSEHSSRGGKTFIKRPLFYLSLIANGAKPFPPLHLHVLPPVMICFCHHARVQGPTQPSFMLFSFSVSRWICLSHCQSWSTVIQGVSWITVDSSLNTPPGAGGGCVLYSMYLQCPQSVLPSLCSVLWECESSSPEYLRTIALGCNFHFGALVSGSGSRTVVTPIYESHFNSLPLPNQLSLSGPQESLIPSLEPPAPRTPQHPPPSPLTHFKGQLIHLGSPSVPESSVSWDDHIYQLVKGFI